MRQIGYIEGDDDAERFSDYLLAQGIGNMVEEGAGRWAVWVEDDDHLDRGRAELTQFLADRDDARYAAAVGAAGRLRKQAAKEEQRRRKQYVDVRTRWGQPRQLVRPVTIVLAAVSIVVSIGATKLGLVNEPPTPAANALYIEPVQPVGEHMLTWSPGGLDAVRRGQVWRLVTPIFLHFHPLHLLFNMFWLLDLGSMIETRRGSLFLLLMVLATAAASNAAEFYLPNPSDPSPLFGGMSGVNYALFGYAWVKGRYQPQDGIGVSPQTTTVMMVWLVACLIPDLIPGLNSGVANVAHFGGLLGGAAFGYLPYAITRARRGRS